MDQCPICGEPKATTQRSGPRAAIYDCQRCGRFRLEFRKGPPSLTDEFKKVRHLISAWIRRQNDAGQPPVLREADFAEGTAKRFHQMGFPETVTEKQRCMLQDMGGRVWLASERNVVGIQSAALIARIAAENQTEVVRIVDLLVERDLVVPVKFSDIHEGPHLLDSLIGYRITARGYDQLDKWRDQKTSSDTAFIAMWFDERTNGFRGTACKAVENTGYRPVIVDEEEYNDFVMNKVVTGIREARFVIADFTAIKEDDEVEGKVRGGSRGGVYWEAGMAFGLGRPVIQTCRNDKPSRQRTHFDIEQYNTIFWEEDKNGHLIDGKIPLLERLEKRILFAVGRGTYEPSAD